jgi:hypothetical protein
VNPSYFVSIVPLYGNVTFQHGIQKVVAFELISKGTVGTTVRFTYTVDTINFTLVQPENEMDIPPGFDQAKSVTIDPLGPVGSHSRLVIEIAYGPDWMLGSSAMIELHITE